MRKILIAAALVLFSVTAQAQEAPATDSEGWRYVAIGAGALGGIWAANVLSAGLLMPVLAGSGIGAGGAVGVADMGAHAGMFVATRAIVVVGGAIAGGYIGAWLYDG
jgi:hypothetical protein